MLEEKYEIKINEINVQDRTVNISKFMCVIKDNIEIFKRQVENFTFYPGDIEKVKEFIGNDIQEEIKLLESIWTDEVIQKTKAAQEAAIKI